MSIQGDFYVLKRKILCFFGFITLVKKGTAMKSCKINGGIFDMQKQRKAPELLSPAGNFEKMESAFRFGADAVYLGGTTFGMRAAPQNFSDEELKIAVDYCHERGVKVYLTCNVLPRNDELSELPSFLENAKAGRSKVEIITSKFKADTDSKRKKQKR